MLVFAGDSFNTDNEYKRLKSLLIGKYTVTMASKWLYCSRSHVYYALHHYPLSDFFRGPTVSAVRLAGLEHVLHFTALDGKIYMRSYR